MTLDEFYTKATNQPSKDFGLSETLSGRASSFRQFNVVGEDESETVRDSIHLDWSPLTVHCAECGVTVKMWEAFAHRLLWNQTWPRAVAFQPLSTRYETERRDSPIEGFVFRLWQWGPEVGDTFTVGRPRKKPRSTSTTSRPPEVAERSMKQDVDTEDEESIFTKYGGSQYNYEPLRDDDDASQSAGGGGLPWVLSSVLPFGGPRNMRGLLSYSDDYGGSRSQNGLSARAAASASASAASRGGRNSVKNLSRQQNSQEIVRLLNVTETIFYATLNHSSPQVIALFTHMLVQKCVQKTPFQPYHCHPHYDAMPNSSTYLVWKKTCLLELSIFLNVRKARCRPIFGCHKGIILMHKATKFQRR